MSSYLVRPLCRSFAYALMLLGYALIGTAAAAPAIDLDTIPAYAPDRVMVSFHPGTPAETVRATHARHGATLVARFDFAGVDLVAVPAGGVETAIARYLNNPNVRFAEPNYYKIMILPNEGGEPPPPSGIGDYWKEQWGLHNLGTIYSYALDIITGEIVATPIPVDPDADIDAPEAWDVLLQDCPDESACPAPRIAILDSGVDCAHVDLQCDLDVNVVKDYIENVPEGDLIGHGTHVAGIAAAGTDNDVGVAGVAWRALIGSYKVCYGYPVSSPVIGLCDSASIVDAIGRARAAGYDVINMSFGGPVVVAAEAAALDAAAADDIVLVSSTGNDYAREGCSFPSTHASVIAVGASDYHDNLASFSNFGDCASVLAPGANIFSTYPGAGCGIAPNDPEGCYTWQSGTSMASPMVAGLAAMIRRIAPAASSQQVRALIEQHADASGARGQNMLAWSEYGRVNAAAAVAAATTTPPPPPASEMYVWSIDMYVRGPNLNIDVAVKWDSDGDGVAEAADDPAVGAILSVELCAEPGYPGQPCNFQTTAVPTNANGEASYKARGANGSFRFQVTNLTHDQYDWNPALDQGNPAYYP